MIDGDTFIKVKPEIVEMTGGDRIVYFTLNGSKASAKVPLDYPVSDNFEIKLNVKNMYFFDSVSGEVL